MTEYFDMQKSFAFLVATALLAGAAPVLARQAVEGVAQTGDRSLPNFRLNIRDANTGELAEYTTSDRAGQFAFPSLQPGSHVVEMVNAAGRVVGLSSPIEVAAGATMTITVSPTAAGAIAGAGNADRRDVSSAASVASVAVAGATSGAAVTAVVATRGGRIVVCHRFSPSSGMSLEIQDRAREAHLAHGDTLGPCPAGVAH